MGNTQRAGEHYDEDATYASVMSYSSLRLMLSLGCASNMRLDIADVKLAYVQSFLDRTLYMSMPEHFKDPTKALRLIRSLYGLKQSGALWSQCMKEWLFSLGFKRMCSDPSLYVCDWSSSDAAAAPGADPAGAASNAGPAGAAPGTGSDGTGSIGIGSKRERVIVGVYVDDLTILSSSDAAHSWFDSNLRKRFPVNPAESRRVLRRSNASPAKEAPSTTSQEPCGTGWILSARIEYCLLYTSPSPRD